MTNGFSSFSFNQDSFNICRLAANFDEWREQARALLAIKVPPAGVQWHYMHPDTLSLFDTQVLPQAQSSACVPADFVALAKYVAVHADPVKWHGS